MNNLLTESAIQALFRGEEVEDPVLQVLNIADHALGGQRGGHHRILLSDGTNTCTGVLMRMLQYLVNGGPLDQYAVIRVTNFSSAPVHQHNRVIMVLGLEIVRTGAEVGGRIGDPQPIGQPAIEERDPSHFRPAPDTTSPKSDGNGNKRRASDTSDGKKSKKRRSTIDYMYEELFLNGLHSDITIRALGKDWKLHKSHLSQSEYFKSMFSANWMESGESVITIEVPDDVNEKALETALASFYKDDIAIPTENVLSVVSAAAFLQVDSLLDMCCDVMKSSVNETNVIDYIKVAAWNSLTEAEEQCMLFLDALFLKNKNYMKKLFLEADVKLLEKILGRPSLIVRSEGTLYRFLLKTVLNRVSRSRRMKERERGKHTAKKDQESDGLGTNEEEEEEKEENGKDKTKEDPENDRKVCQEDDLYSDLLCRRVAKKFVEVPLAKEELKPYEGLFKHVRLRATFQNVNWRTLKIVFTEDKLLDEYQMLHKSIINGGECHGPRKSKVSIESFQEHCLRCGVCMYDNNFRNIELHCPKHLGFNCGVSLNLSYTKKARTFFLQARKAVINHNSNALVRLQVHIQNADGKIIHRLKTDITEVDVHKNSALVVPWNAQKDVAKYFVGVEALFTAPPQHSEKSEAETEGSSSSQSCSV